jgi:plastocyanin
MPRRRTYLRTAAALTLGSVLAGCTSDGGGDSTPTPEPTATPTPEPTATATPASSVTEVAVGPEGRLRYDPDAVEISVGDTVRWEAMSPGHNVTSHSDASPKCENPEGADPFTSYEGDEHFAIMDVGRVFEHEFTVPGEYVYVCTPHAGQGMVASVTVTE